MQKKILLWFDVEDYATIESDDAFAELLEMLEEVGARSTIKFCAKKLQLLQERGRTDILSRLKNHEISFHTTLHSVHPLPTEYLDHYGFADGAREFERRERDGVEAIREISGQNLTSYGQPGESWAPQVFPALRKWGIPTYLDAHSILGINGQPFWYGGVLCYTDLVNLIRLQHRDGGLEQYIRDFESIRCDGQEAVFISTYDHPTEFSCSVFWDEVNFLDGRNPQVLQPAPLRAPGEQSRYIDMMRDFLRHTQKCPDVEYVTASEGLALEIRRKRPITGDDLRAIASTLGDRITFAEVGGSYLSASEIFSLAARYLTGRFLTPELLYGPEAFADSVIQTPKVEAAALAKAALDQVDTVEGFKQLRTLYRIGDNFLNPVDLLCTMLEAIHTGEDVVEIRRGTLAAADYVREPKADGGWTSWILWKKDFYPENIYRHTRLQTWTLKPAVF